VYPLYATTRLYVVWVVTESTAAVQLWTLLPLLSVLGEHVTMLGSSVPLSSRLSVTKEEMFCWPEDVTPSIVKFTKVSPSAGMLAVVGLIVIEETVSAAVAVVVPVIEPEAAVMVVVPAETPVNNPPLVMVATVVSELDQHTELPVQLVPPLRVPELPSL
jgi:hypothetical protein